MKRYTMILALVLMVAMPMMAERVTPETARKVAATFLSNNGAKAAQLTDLSKAAGFSNLYIFNGEQGFVVMAADDCVQPILGYSLTGGFVVENMPTNVSGWLQGYNDEIQYAVDSKMKATAETAKLWRDLISGNSKAGRATAVVDNLLSTIWDQDPYYNAMCPYDSQVGELTVTGCVATAMAQIMRYWEHPIHGTGSHSYTHSKYGVQSANYGNTTYNWDNMPNSIHSANNDIAQLMYHCGVSVDMDYNIADNGGSGAATADVANALTNYFDYQQSTFRSKVFFESSWVSMLKAELDNGRPLQYSGRGSGGGHSFVCCGYDSDDNFYFNWGWSGRNDGFYALNNLVPGSGGSGGAGYSFTQSQGAIFGIQPNTPSIDPPTIATAVNGTNVTITWNEISDADSYRLYRNGNLIESSLTTTSYTDTDLPYGEHAYHVKSVKSNGTMSLKSNISVATVSFEGPVATDLTASINGNTINLSWTAPASESAILQYGSANPSSYIGFAGQAAFYWAQRYPVTTLASYAGMAFDKVSVYFGYLGTYTLYIYNGNETGTSDLMYQTNYTASSTGWKDIDVTSIVPLDYTSDLWVVMYAPQSIAYPAGYCSYSGSGVEDASYYSSSGSGWYSMGNNASWVMKTYITDGTYTYNLYDNSTTVATDLATTQYTVSNPSNNTAHRYTVKTNYYGGETEASNMVGFALGNASLASLTLGANDMMTVTEGSKLTVSGTISNSDPAHLVLEEGAQLESSAVAGTMYKDINGYTTVHNDHEGYYLIASPVDGIQPTQVTNMTNGTYDLYAWDANEQLEWRNYEVQGNFTTLDAGVGYLYANNATTTLAFAGQLNSSFTGIGNLNYVANDDLHSLTLVGNPYAYQAEFSIADTHNGGWVSAPNCLTLNSEGDGFEVKPVTGNEIVLAPMEAVLVQATGNGQSFTEYGDIEPIGDGGEIEVVPGLLNLSISKPHGGVMDNALVRFNGGSMLRKLRLGHNATELYIPQDGKDYAVVCAQAETEIPVNFKASQNGTYTLSIDSQNLDLDYLHLIDNMTGEDVDFLATPSYTFEGNTNDYESRFRLVFAPIREDANGDNEHFAFYADGEIRLVETYQDASLQVVDMMGRVVLAGDAINRVSTSRLAAGVYVVRLINGEKVKTQKIVVR